MAGNNFTQDFMRRMAEDSIRNQNSSSQIIQGLASIQESLDRLIQTDENLRRFISGEGIPSQSSARDRNDANRGNLGPFGQHHANNLGRNKNNGKSFLDGFEKTLLDSLGGSQFKNRLQRSLDKFAESLGTDVESLGKDVGEQLGKMVANSIKKSKAGDKFTAKLNSLSDSIFQYDQSITDMLKNIKDDPDADLSFFADQLKKANLGEFGNIVLKSGTTVVNVLSKLTGGIAGPLIALAALDKASEGVATTLAGTKKLIATLNEAGNRYYSTRQKNLEEASKRLEADVHTLVETPFKILTQAANEVYDAWNANIRLIAGTQGYDKADLQDLMSAYAQRLQQEGLSNVVAATDVYNNLAKVIQAGLSGNAAVEFAYQATKYNAAIPNQDFFSLVDSYSSVAANAIAAGKSEAEALNIANQSLADFSNSLLYASRNLVGGYSTGLKSADSIYASAVKIAQAARSENLQGISSSLLAIQGYVGSIAPDLANTLSDKIYQLATGGNSADIVALRSLAGINASNTEFLRALTTNPQSVLSNMFANLGRMFSESSDAYMEKAEGYASLFGLSAEALQRIDFMSLANAINNMNINSNTLDENLKLLQEGQTTTSTDQLKIAQINKYMVEEGLAYVIDNEAAQMIQQHMWDEQLAREMQQAEYGVHIVGGVAESIEKILSGIEMVINLINPLSWLSKIGNIVKSVDEAADLQADVKSLLEQTVVGQGNYSDLYNLTARNQDLKLTQSLVEMLGGTARYGNSFYNTNPLLKVAASLTHPVMGLYDLARKGVSVAGATSNTYASGEREINTPTSRYNWGSISKSGAALASALLATDTVEQVTQSVVSNVTGTVSTSVALVQEKINKMLSSEYLEDQFVKAGKSYEEWKASASSFGITDIDKALKESGYNTKDIEEYFLAKQTEAGMAEKYALAEQEKQFRESGLQFWNTRFWDEYSTPITEMISNLSGENDSLTILLTDWRDSQMEILDSIYNNQVDWKTYFNTAWVEEAWKTNFIGESGYFTKFFDEFVKKFITNTYYNDSGYTYSDVTDVQRRETAQKGDAVYALADALTSNLVDLKDPQVQTNAILAQILVIVTAIMNQNNNVAGTVSLSDALSSLALGLTTTTPLSETPLAT